MSTTMKPGDWVAVQDYDDEEGTSALVLATSQHKAVINQDEATRLIAEANRVHTRNVTWWSVLVSDRDIIGDEYEFNEEGSGRRWVEAALCVDVRPTDDGQRVALTLDNGSVVRARIINPPWDLCGTDTVDFTR